MPLKSPYVQRRLSDFLAYTQQYRVAMVIVAAVWFVAVGIAGIEIESGEGGKMLIGLMITGYASTILIVPRIARRLHRRGKPADTLYGTLLVADALLVAAAVPLTGGRVSMTFLLYYLFAIGNCYMFTPRGTFLANSFLGLSYAGTLWLMQLQGHPYAPTLLDWVDILLVRIPLIYIVAGYAKWLAMRGDQIILTDQEKYLETLKGFLQALEARDGYTLRHSRNVGFWAAAFATSRGSGEEQVQLLRHASELHDIGKIGIPDSILNKPGSLLAEEITQMREHSQIGARISQHLKWLTADHLAVIRNHHERWDGTGYPDRLAGTRIPYVARLAALCDVFDALTHDRPYRRGMPVSRALEMIARGRGTHFDPQLTDDFLRFVEGMLAALRHHFAFRECSPVTWTEDGLQVLLVTDHGEVLVRLVYEFEEGWRYLGVVTEPASQSESGIA